MSLQWQDRAECKGHAVDLWFPAEDARGRDAVQRTRQAKAICDTCPVRQECLDYAIANHITDGIFGAMTIKERRDYERRRLGVDRLPIPGGSRTAPLGCGTDAAWQRHWRRGEQPCDACKAAHAAAVAGRKRPAQCGTPRGFAAHRKRGESPCAACRAAQAAASRPHSTRDADCGTNSGAARHRRLGEPLCDACAAAQREYQRQYKARKRAQKKEQAA